jgi:hypothetical protein
MSESGVVKMVFRERLSTAATADDVVERGFGLSVVQAEVRHLGGQIGILTKVGSGKRVEMTPRPRDLHPRARPNPIRVRHAPPETVGLDRC